MYIAGLQMALRSLLGSLCGLTTSRMARFTHTLASKAASACVTLPWALLPRRCSGISLGDSRLGKIDQNFCYNLSYCCVTTLTRAYGNARVCVGEDLGDMRCKKSAGTSCSVERLVFSGPSGKESIPDTRIRDAIGCFLPGEQLWAVQYSKVGRDVGFGWIWIWLGAWSSLHVVRSWCLEWMRRSRSLTDLWLRK